MRLFLILLSLVLVVTAQNGISFNHLVYRLRELEYRRNNVQLFRVSQAPSFWEFLPSRSNPSGSSLKLNPNCQNDFYLVVGAIGSALASGFANMTSFELNVALKMLDASGKIPPGILHGNHNFMGQYSECVDIDASLPNTTRHIQGSYNRFVWAVNGSCTDKHTIKFGWDICAPKSCAYDKDLMELSKLVPNWKVCSVMTMAEQKAHQKEVVGKWLVVAFMGAVAVIGIAAAVYDYFILPHHKDQPYVKTMYMKMFLAFSFYTNICEIFNTEHAKKAGQIGPIHCIRFFSMCWVILGHTLMVFLLYSNNPVDVMAELKFVSTQIITNAYYAVDSFLFLSGLLVAYMWFKSLKRNRRQTMSAPAWALFYVHRLLRLSPPYYIAILFYTFVFRTFLFNMPVYMTEVLPDPCPKNWWVNLLYLNNFIHYDEQCYLVSWYLSTDLQIYIFAPLILIPMAIRPLFGYIAAGGLFLASTAANLATVFALHYPPSDFGFGAQDPKTKHMDMYTMLIYDAPWIRCQPYIIGMMTGYLLIQKPKLRINRILNLVLWMVTAGLMAASTLTLFDWSNGTEMPLTGRAMYSAFSKPAWGLALSWIIISSFYGYGGPINSFMSWEIWVPLGRLSYCAYLIHVCVVVYVTGLTESDLIWSSFSQSTVSFIIPVIGLTYFFSIFWSSAFEISLGKVEGLLIGGLRAPRPPRPEAPKQDIDMSGVVSRPAAIKLDTDVEELKSNGKED